MSSGAFTEDKYELAYPEGIEHHYWSRARHGVILRTLKKHGLATRRILEIGCGKGIVVKFLRSHGVECSGIELARVGALPAVKRFIITGADALTAPPSYRQSFDAILLLDVIEHLENPERFLRELLSAYPNVCSVVITVPARSELWSNYDTFYGHYRRYDIHMVRELAHLLGLRVQEARYFFKSLYLAGVMMIRMSGKRPVRMSAPKGPGKLLHSLLSGMLRLEDIILPGAMRGSSIVAVFKRETGPCAG